MAVRVNFGDAEKRRNSTYKMPLGAAYECDFKYPVSEMNPVLLLHMPAQAYEPPTWSCAYIEAFNRYYFVDDAVVVSATQWEIHLSVDVLATYKEELLASNAMIVRASTRYNTDLIDNMLPTTVSQESTTIQQNFLAFGEGSYILTIVGGDRTAGIGGVAQYALSRSQAQELTSALSETALLEEVSRYFANPYESIIGLIWQPFTVSGPSARIMIGEYNTGVTGTAMPTTPTLFTTTLEAELPYSDYRRKTQTEITLTLPGVGAIDIDPTILVYRREPLEGGLAPDIPKGFSIRIEAQYDPAVGDVHYKVVEPNSNSLIALADGNVAVELMTATRSTNIGQAITAVTMAAGAAIGIVGSFGAVSAIGGSFSTAARYAAGLGGSTAGMLSNGLIQMNRQTPYTTGHIGGKAAINDNKLIYLTIRARSVSQEPASAAPTLGLPVYRVEPLNNYRGQYVVCTLSDFKAGCTGPERDALYSLVNSPTGIYFD